MGRGLGVNAGLGVGEGLGEPLGVAVAIGVGVGVAVTVAVGVGAPAWAQYLPPVSKKSKPPVVPPRRSSHCPSILLCGVKRAAGAPVRACGCPTIGAEIVSAPGAKTVARDSPSSPYDHLTAPGPHCGVIPSGIGGVWWCLWWSSYPCPVCISRRCSTRYGQIRRRRSFRCRSTQPCERIERPARWWCCGCCPTIGAGIVSPAGIHEVAENASTPDDHFTASPHGGVRVSWIRRVGGACGCPTVGAGIVFPSRVQIGCIISSTPDDHFTASPHCCMVCSCFGRVGGAGSRPTIGAGIASPACRTSQIESVLVNSAQTIISLPV